MSEIKVNKISPRTACGTVTVGDSGDSVCVSAGVAVTVQGDLKSPALKATDGGNIVSQSGTTVTLGASGDTVALASGATQTGFGRTGTVDWVTTPKVTGDSPITAVTGEGYFLNTTAGTITINLPVGAAGSIVSMADYAGTWQTNAVTVAANGTEKIGGVDADVTLNTEGQSVTLVYIDSTQGWLNTMDSTSNVRGETFVTATGGTPCAGAISGNCKVHTFTGPGTFCVSAIAGCASNNLVSYMVVAGGGSGGSTPPGNSTGGGGAGGFREYKSSVTPYTASPLDGNPCGTAITVSASPYTITVGGGGASVSSSASGNNGNPSTFSTITSTAGGYGGREAVGGPGGSGGGGAGGTYNQAGGTGNTPPTTPSQGFAGGTSATPPAPSDHPGGGGGGATVVGTSGTAANGPGGAGATTEISASPVVYAGGGGSSQSGPSTSGAGGSGGGGAGNAPGGAGTAGGCNTGGGGGGAAYSGPLASGQGGSGIVIIRYKFQ